MGKRYAYLKGRELLVADDSFRNAELKDFLFGQDDTDEADTALANGGWIRVDPWETIHRGVLAAEVRKGNG